MGTGSFTARGKRLVEVDLLHTAVQEPARRTGGAIPLRRSRTLPVWRPCPVTGRTGGFTRGVLRRADIMRPGFDGPERAITVGSM